MKINPSEIFLATVILQIVFYELIAIYFKFELLTSVIWRWTTEAPVFAFALGVLAGHLFWPHGYWIKEKKDDENRKISD